MEEVRNLVLGLVGQVETILNRGFDNVYITTALKVFLGLYAAFAAPQLPPTLANLMDNVLVRIGFAFTIVLLATRDPSLALMVAIAFVVTLQTANKFRLINTNLSVSDEGESSWLPSAKSGESVEVPAEATSEQPMLPHHANGYEEDQLLMKGSQPSENFANTAEEPQPHETNDFTQNAFTTTSQFLDVQDNAVPGSNQDTCVQTFSNQHCTQGLQENGPNGA